MSNDWISWNGGECPVDGDVRVDVVYRDGLALEGWRAGGWGWDRIEGLEEDDILAYRISALDKGS